MSYSKVMSFFLSKKFLFVILVGSLLLITFPIVKKFVYKTTVSNHEPKKDYPELEELASNKYFSHFPVRIEDFESPPKMYGLWPYGIKGSDGASHNEGHPGWDFELKKGSKVYAISDIHIAQIHDGDTKSGNQVLKVIEAYAILQNQRFHIVYHSVTNLEEGVFEGATISAGLPLAEAGLPLSDTTRMIHFGVFKPRDSVGSCPTPYFSETLQPVIAEMVSRSIDVKTGKSYESACVGKIDRKLYLSNYPEREQYLEGAEEFED